jgi:hypothetical protein
MKKNALLVALSVLQLSAMLLPSICKAGSTDVVINVGDWFKYERKVTQWISEDPFLPEGYFGPLSLADNETTSVVYTVTAITPVTEPAAGKNVTFLVTYNWKNGSVTTETMVEHVSTANQNIFMIGADMNAPAKVSDTFDFLGMGFFQYPERAITRTFDYANPTATRTTNECNYTIDISGSIYNYTMWWDKATGMRIYYENHGNVGAIFTAAYEYTVVYKLVDSSIPNLSYVPEMFTAIVMLMILGASTASIVFYRRKKLPI